MSLPAFLLLVATAVQVVGPLFAYPERWRRLVWLVVPILVGWQVWHDAVLLSMVPVYLLLALLFLSFLYRSYRQWRGKPTRIRDWLRTVALLLSLPLLAVPVVEVTVIPFDHKDYRRQSWTEAFDNLHATLQERYAFGQWKRIDWDELYATHYSNIVAAERSGEREAYYVALREYIYTLPDGHVSIYSNFHDEVERAAIGGGFGFAVLELDDGRVIAHIVEPYAPVAEAGMAWGAEILRWDDKPISEAAAAVSTVWASRPPATAQSIAITQHQLLTRAPIGAKRTVTFRNPGESQTRTSTLKARDDSYRTYEKSVDWQMVESPAEAVRYEILADGVGYVQIASLEPSPNVPKPVEEVNRAMQHMLDEDVQALILDVRGNRGGLDTLVPRMMSHFTPARLHYEHVTYYNRLFGNFRRLFSLYVNPSDQPFTEPVTVLVDHRTKSSGEGFGLIAKSLPNVTVVGIHGTDGSFGMSSASIMLPTGIDVGYPWGQSLNQSDVVQVDSNHLLEGGIQLDISVPLTFETARSIYVNGDDAVLDFARDILQKEFAEQ